MRSASISLVEKTCISKIPETLKGHCRAEITKFCLLDFNNIQLSWIKRFYRAKQKQRFGEKVQDYRDGSGLQFISFEFKTLIKTSNKKFHRKTLLKKYKFCSKKKTFF